MTKVRAREDDEVNLQLLNPADVEEAEAGVNPPLRSDVWASARRKITLFSAKHKGLLVKLVYGVLLSFIAVFIISVYRSETNNAYPGPTLAATLGRPADMSEGWAPLYQNKSLYVASENGTHFRDNIMKTTKYVAAFPIGGFIEQTISQINLLYLASLTRRVPVMADFVPKEMRNGSGFIPVSDVYDLARLSESLLSPILEWADIKERNSGILDEIGYVSLTPVPDSRFGPDTNHVNIMAAASLGWPGARKDALLQSKTLPSPIKNHTLPPDEHMLCYDSIYYAATTKDYEWFEEWTPAWTLVGRHMRWAPNVESLARNYISKAFDLKAGEPFPPYIGVHVSHMDFVQLCNDGISDCSPPLSVYHEKVKEIKHELFALHGLSVNKVLIISDGGDAAWWNIVQDYGWHRIDWTSDTTTELSSQWYPIVLDSIALSLAKGFVGTKHSTLSLLATKRVQDWEHGFTREV
ncbi:hypothetical protein BU17DRAFT_83942 [Hysterangium stoloniferum]|nr:hypothetical protein BU17DRAFT_83942 [Hysterangium stoloniferum]